MPRSAMPSSVITMISSELRIVERRWAIVNSCPVFRQLLQALLDPTLALVIQGACSLVQDKDAAGSSGIRGQWRSAASDRRRALSRARLHRCRCLSGSSMIKSWMLRPLCRLHDLIHGSARFSIGDILSDRAAEQIDVLLDHSDLASQAFELKRAHILPVYGDPSPCDIIETGKQRTDRRLSAS